MIVLDEQLLGRGIAEAIAQWYPGAVRFITDLRPNTVIKDDAIPSLLSREVEPTFVTLNATDFWRKIAITDQICVICIALSESRAAEIPALLQRLLHHPDFRTKAQRMGCMIRLTVTNAAYYTVKDSTVLPIENW